MSCGHGCPGRLLARAALVLAAILLSAPAARPQTADDGAIGGLVLTPSGSPVRGASITARSIDTGLEVRATSGRSGEFLLIRLPVGPYRLFIEAPGQPSPASAATQVRLGEVTEIEARLRALTPLLPAPSPDSGQAELAGLPIPSGQWRALELASASADPVLTPDASPGEASFRGIDPTQNTSRIDGASAQESFSGQRLGGGPDEDDSATDTPNDPSAGPGAGSRSVDSGGRRAGSAYIFSGSAIREFRVQPQADAAQYGSALSGHGAGGVLSTTSRSGSIRFHGQAIYTVRSSAWAAADPFSIVSTYTNGVPDSFLAKPHDLRQQFGGGLGGPVPLAFFTHAARRQTTPRLFFFYAFDAQRRSFPAISTPGYAGFYSLTSTQTALLANRGVSTASTAAALAYLSSLTGTVARRADQEVNFARLDWQRRSSQRITLEYNRARWSNPAGARTAPVLDRAISSIGSSFGSADMGVLRYVQFITPRISNEIRLQYSRELQYETTQAPLPQEPAIGPGGLPPEVSIGPSGFVFGTPAGLGRRAWPDERRLELADVASWVRGRQLLQLGADFSYIHDYTDSLPNSEGTFSYDSGSTNGHAGGLVDWITDFTFGVHAYPNGGCPSITAPTHDFCFRSYSQSFGQQSLSFSRQEWAGFFQDDWRLSPALTLHAGLRYEYSFLPLPQDPNAAIDSIFGAQGATSVFPEDRNNLGPRLGLVWQPFRQGQGVVRAGYGAYYGRLPGATLQAALLDTAQPASISRIRIVPTTETVCPQVPTVGFGYPCSFLTEPSGVVAATTSAALFDRRFRLPLLQQGTLSYERRTPGGIVARLGYTMNLDRQLPNSVDINVAPSADVRVFQLQGGTGALGVRDGETFAVPVYTTRLNPSFGPVTALVSNANATYHGLTVDARRGFGAPGTPRLLRGLEFHVSWTWSKAIDFGQNAGARPRSNGQFDPFTVRYDKGLSALNFPHRIVGSAIWAPPGDSFAALFPDGRPRRIARAFVSGWSLGTIATETSGRGYSYEIFGGSRLIGGRESINGSGGSRVLPTVGRNTLRLPDRQNLDLRLGRSFSLPRDGMRLEARAEAFNLTNHVNITGVEQRAFLVEPAVNGITPLVFQDAATVAAEGLNVQPFGTYTSSSTTQSRARELQFTLRLEF